MAHTLATHTVPAAAADGSLCTAAVLLGGIVVAFGAFAVWTQATRVAEADATLVGAVAVVAFRAVGLCFGLALAVTLEGDGDGEGVLEAHRLDDEGFLLLFGATSSSGFHTKGDLDERKGADE